MLRPLNEEEFNREAKDILINLCGTVYPDPFSKPFSENVDQTVILYDYSWVPFGKVLTALVVAASKQGDRGFYLSFSLPHEFNPEQPSQWYIPFEELFVYENKTLAYVKEYVHYSPQGVWGIVPSDEGHAVLGGTREFIEDMLYMLPEIKYQVKDFINYWKEMKQKSPKHYDVTWMETLLANTYGEESAKKYLDESDWGELLRE